MEHLPTEKVKNLSELSGLLEKLRSQGTKIVLCHGVFDLIHIGHMRYLNSAKKFGDVLVVTTTADAHVKRGPGRPVFNQELRAEALSNLEVVDFVSIVDAPTAIECIEAVRPDFYVKGPDYANKAADVTGKIYDEEAAVSAVGGKLVFTDDETFSSSQLLNLYIDPLPPATLSYIKALLSKNSVEAIGAYLRQAAKVSLLKVDKDLPGSSAKNQSFEIALLSDQTLLSNKELVRALKKRAKKLAVCVNLKQEQLVEFARGDANWYDCICLYSATIDADQSKLELQTTIRELADKVNAAYVLMLNDRGGSLSYTKSGGFSETPALTIKPCNWDACIETFSEYAVRCYSAGVPTVVTDFISSAAAAMSAQAEVNKVEEVDLQKFVARLLKV